MIGFVCHRGKLKRWEQFLGENITYNCIFSSSRIAPHSPAPYNMKIWQKQHKSRFVWYQFCNGIFWIGTLVLLSFSGRCIMNYDYVKYFTYVVVSFTSQYKHDWLTVRLPISSSMNLNTSHPSLLRIQSSIHQLMLTHWGREKMDAISQTTFSSAFRKWKCLNSD